MSKRIQRRQPRAHQLTTLPSILQRIYAARDVQTMEDLDRSLSALLPYRDLQDIDKAVVRLMQAIL